MPSIMEPDIEPVIFTCCRKARPRLSPPQDKTFPETPGVGTELERTCSGIWTSVDEPVFCTSNPLTVVFVTWCVGDGVVPLVYGAIGSVLRYHAWFRAHDNSTTAGWSCTNV